MQRKMSIPIVKSTSDMYNICTTLALQRRSRRLKQKEYALELASCIQTDKLGYLAVLPTEILYHAFSFLNIQDLSILTLTSKEVRDLVMEYNDTKEGFRKLMPPVTPKPPVRIIKVCLNYEKERMVHFRDAGLLMKRSTCLNPTKDRLKKVDHFISKLQNSSRFKVLSHKSMVCYGKFISTFLRGWEEKECLRAYVSLTDVHNMTHKILTVLSRKPGYNPLLEYQIRAFFRIVLLDQCDDEEDLAMWLNFILKPFPLVHQARLLYLLYGPLCPEPQRKEMINWESMSETSLLPSPPELISSFSDFATAFRALLSHHDWNDDDVISVLEELTACPDEWMTENIARLLIECADPICMRVLTSKAINGKMQELGNIIVAFAVVRFHEQMPMSWLLHLIQQICGGMKNPQDIKAFLSSISDTFKDIMMSLPEFPDDEDDLQLHHVAVAQADFMRELLVQTFL
ncbi:F-box only protein 47-like [Amphiura filiformis]|uniref:F-box only protein 47-like n=1 Tax=Amphiura filiformis TaxID=82378 RepID=UPI003B216D32